MDKKKSDPQIGLNKLAATVLQLFTLETFFNNIYWTTKLSPHTCVGLAYIRPTPRVRGKVASPLMILKSQCDAGVT